MMQVVRFSLLVSIICNYLLIFVEAQSDSNAFDSNINSCFFDRWKIGTNSLLASKVKCNGGKRTGLCYGLNRQALFAVCYNKNFLIPEFTGHIIKKVSRGSSKRNMWRNEEGKYAPKPQSDIKDYRPHNQKNIIPNFNDKKQLFYSRGHLIPNGDFSTDKERALTMVNTNIAPQWQLFNAGNWADLEAAVRSYSNDNNRPVYVVTGTGGMSMMLKNDTKILVLLNKRVLVPKYFWKAVCDPAKNSSIVFVAENPTGTENTTEKNGCTGIKQTPGKGIVNCYSLDELTKREEAKFFQLPPFSNICNPSKRGTFLDQYLNRLK